MKDVVRAIGATDPINPAVAGEWRAGWRAVVGSSVSMGTGVGLLMLCASQFLAPMHREFGGSLTSVTFIPVIAIVMAFCAPVIGLLVDRWGSRPVGIFGLAYLAAGLFALALVPANSVALFIVAGLIGLGAPATSVIPYTRCVATWFRQGIGTAIGCVMNGVAITSVIVVPLVSATIQTYGWRSGFALIGAIVVLFGLPLAIVFLRDRPIAVETAGRLQEAVAEPAFTKDIRFWMVLIAIGLGAIPLGGFMAHFHSILANSGIDITIATNLNVVFVVSIMVGRIGGGVLLDRCWDGAVALMLMALAALGAVLLGEATSAMPLLIIGLAAFLVGMGQGAEGDFLAFFSLKIFGIRRFSTIVGIYAMASGLGFAAGGFGFSALYDQQNDYRLASFTGGGLYLLSGLIIFLTRLFDRSLRPGASGELGDGRPAIG